MFGDLLHQDRNRSPGPKPFPAIGDGTWRQSNAAIDRFRSETRAKYTGIASRARRLHGRFPSYWRISRPGGGGRAPAPPPDLGHRSGQRLSGRPGRRWEAAWPNRLGVHAGARFATPCVRNSGCRRGWRAARQLACGWLPRQICLAHSPLWKRFGASLILPPTPVQSADRSGDRLRVDHGRARWALIAFAVAFGTSAASRHGRARRGHPRRPAATISVDKDLFIINPLSWESGVLVGGRVKPGQDAFVPFSSPINAQRHMSRAMSLQKQKFVL